MSKVAIFPGSFDPFTTGHEEIVSRGLKIFDKIIIAIGHNSKKNKRYFDINIMYKQIKNHYIKEKKINVLIYDELTISLAKRIGANFILRGLRNTIDFEYEKNISQMNKKLGNKIETIFIMANGAFCTVNSSIIREVHKNGGNINDFLAFELN